MDEGDDKTSLAEVWEWLGFIDRQRPTAARAGQARREALLTCGTTPIRPDAHLGGSLDAEAYAIAHKMAEEAPAKVRGRRSR